MITRRTLLKVGAAAALAPTLTTAQAKRSPVKRLIVLVPHPDDEVLSMWPALHYLASGYDVHFVYITRGDVTAASLKLDGSAPCASHGYTHNPAMEGYTVPTQEQIGLSRLHEGMSAVGAMWRIPRTIPGDVGDVFTHDKNLGSQFGSGGAGSSTAPVVPEAVDAVELIIRELIADYPGSLFWSMSPTDDHCDHAAIGQALRRLKGTPVYQGGGVVTYTGGDPILAGGLANSRFMVSKLYWGNSTTPRPADVLAEKCAWWPNAYPNNFSDATLNFTRRAEYTAWLRDEVVPMYKAWQPAQGAFGIGGLHSTPSQFASCFGPQLTTVSALWHP